MQAVRFQPGNIFDGLGQALCCAACGDAFLHQIGVDVFSRDSEDSASGRHTTIVQERTFVDTDLADNPSPRRDGLIITFWCETCDASTELVILQHKGAEFVSVRVGQLFS